MIRLFGLTGLILILNLGQLGAQSTNAPLNEDYYHWVDRYEVKSGRLSPELFTSVKPYQRKAIVAFVDSLQARSQVFTSRADQFNYEYLRNDNWEWSRAETSTSKKPFLNHFYKKKSDLLYVDQPEFDLHVSPVLYAGIGKDSNLGDPMFINLRGVEMRGMIDRKVGFYTFLGENQSVLPSYVQSGLTGNPVIPHELFWKKFKDNGVDFFQVRAYIDFNISKHINFQFGQDRTNIGNGYRSLIFSDFAPTSLFMRANVKVWKINYLFQLNRVAADVNASVGGSGQGPYPMKYIAFHHASINIGKKFNLGLFESVVFDADSSSHFDASYLNPVIFYRAIEQQFGSTDNVLVGADFKWNAVKKLSFYGQFVLDEFVLDQIKSGDGWWANKFAIQGGLKYIDVAGINNLDLQLESNIVRPFTYSHNSDFGSYTNYRQPMAHPLGANFNEVVGIVRYQPLPRLHLTVKGFYAKKGQDANATDNEGGDLLKNNNTRISDYGNTIGQGVQNKIMYVDLTASYMVRHNFFIDVKHIQRDSKSDLSLYNSNTSITSLALRWNIAQRGYEF
ncbi:MAG: hypothetical protein C0523_10310 [Cytophaga sp.]|nr:hypothetical protein [Cytophaga sp.]